jgi:hypothetical protein
MDFLSLSGVFDAAGAIAWGAIITYLVLVAQSISFIPMPQGSKARVWAIGGLSVLVVGLAVWERAAPVTPDYLVEIVLSFANLVAAAAGVRASTKVALPKLTTMANGAG